MLDLLQNEKIVEVKRLREQKTQEFVELTAQQLGIPDTFRNLYQSDATVGDLIDAIAKDPQIQAKRDDSYTVNTTVGKLVDLVGSEKVRTILLYETRDGKLNPEYENTKENIADYWGRLVGFTILFAALATVILKFIDKDKR